MGYELIAAVDLGSNSFRLQVGRVVANQIYPLDGLKEAVRLAAGLGTDKRLDAASQQRGVAALSRFAERLRGFDAGAVRAVATNTLRVAKNAVQFLEKAEAALGFPIEVIAGREEARLIYLGVAHTLANPGTRQLVVDIGGGSTEFIIGQSLEPIHLESLYMGCVSFSLRFFPEGRVDKRSFKEAELAARVMSAKLMLKHKVKKHQMEAAVSLKREHIEENSVEYEMRDSAGYSIPHNGKDLYMVYSLKARNELNANRMEAYIQDTYRFSGGTADSTGNRQTHYTLNYGIRMSHWNFNRETIVSPRLSLAIIPANHENTTLRFAAGLYYQAPFFKELRDTSTVNGITIASLNKKIKSQRSIHFIAGYDYRFKLGDQRYKFSAEAYYKALGNLVPYSVSNVKVVYYGQNECSGHAAGLDFKLYGEFVPGTDSWLSLSLMDTKMKLGGKSIPLPTDQRYAVNLFFTDYFPGSKKWRMSLKLAFADGLPFAAPHRELETNSFRATAYRRADIGMSYQLLDNSRREKKTFLKNVMLGVDCLNLFGIDNVNSYYWVTDVTGQQYAVPNYLTGRQLNARILLEF